MIESDSKAIKPIPGTISWFNKTCENAGEVREFYESVIGWQSDTLPDDGYGDFGNNPHVATVRLLEFATGKAPMPTGRVAGWSTSTWMTSVAALKDA